MSMSDFASAWERLVTLNGETCVLVPPDVRLEVSAGGNVHFTRSPHSAIKPVWQILTHTNLEELTNDARRTTDDADPTSEVGGVPSPE